jgi:hypothetical protein
MRPGDVNRLGVKHRLGDFHQRQLATVNTASAPKNCHGKAVRPRSCANGETVNNTPTATTARVAAVSTTPGLLRMNGKRRVRIAKMISVWVASDSTNHPVRNTTGPA